jgi:spermidine/putrescine-binding protein
MNASRQVTSARFRIVLLAALLLPMLMVRPSVAQDAPLVIATWGGAYTDALTAAFAEPFTEATGTPVQFVDAPGGFNAMLEAQAEAGNVTWDIVDLGEEDAVAMIDAGLLQPIPDDVKADLIEAVGEENVTDYGISFASYGSVIVCNTAAAEACPTTPAEFWDVENFPGRRALYGDGWSDSLVYALQADGVAKEDLFPLDVDRAFAKMDEIKPHINVWWTTGDQSQQIFRDEEVVMGILWDGRAAGLRDQGVADPGATAGGADAFTACFPIVTGIAAAATVGLVRGQVRASCPRTAGLLGVVAVNRRLLAANNGITGVGDAHVVAVADDRRLLATKIRITRVDQACVVAVAGNRRVLAAKDGIARILSTGVFIVTIHGLRGALAVLADRGVAGIAWADVAARAAVVDVSLQVHTRSVTVRLMRFDGVLRDFDVDQWVGF